MSTADKSAPTNPSPTPPLRALKTWRHPRLDEINRRRYATVFSEKNARMLVFNGIVLCGLSFVRFLATLIISPDRLPTCFRESLGLVWFFIEMILTVNVIIACLPLLRGKDDLSDIALTPIQRELLALPPTSIPPPPGEKYMFPPPVEEIPSPAGPEGRGQGRGVGSPLLGQGGPWGPLTTEARFPRLGPSGVEDFDSLRARKLQGKDEGLWPY